MRKERHPAVREEGQHLESIVGATGISDKKTNEYAALEEALTFHDQLPCMSHLQD